MNKTGKYFFAILLGAMLGGGVGNATGFSVLGPAIGAAVGISLVYYDSEREDSDT